ncbi:MAG TPA: chromosomal replication initiator protein DnaA [Solirubrobacteraceae bacterium]|nr:chromosomal replication initiator protein DnaA [Solirubrobacteraceae bacterium]
MSAELEHIWSRVQSELSAAVDESTYRIWLEPLRVRKFEDGVLSLEASPQACGWIRDRFGRVLQACAAAVLGADAIVDVNECAPDGRAGASHDADTRSTRVRDRSSAPRRQQQPPPRDPHALSTTPVELVSNPKLTFDQFVIGDSNRLAHAAALTVAEMPGQAYNPLFICGPPGVGKTHLLRSIAGLLVSHDPSLRVRYATGESFTADFLRALNDGLMEDFKAHFRQLDVLLVDDVQFLERKTRTEEEFFHTFNELYDSGSQIVLSSDRPPRDLQALEDRLRERFESGLVADVRPPDLSTRLTILRKRVQHDRIELADPRTLNMIAERITLNVRAIEGALIRVVAFGSLTGRPLTPELAQEVLDSLYPDMKPAPRSISEIQAAACEVFGISPEELLSSTRSARIAWPRQMAMYLARELTGESLPAIGRLFGGRDHTTVLHAWKRTQARIASDPESRKAVQSLRSRLDKPRS